MRNRRRGPRLRPALDQLDDRVLLSALSGYLPGGYTPAQISSAYGVSGISFTSKTRTTIQGDGTGETIALIEMDHDPNLPSDLATFDAKYNLPTPALSVVDQAGTQTDSGWSLEEAMDVEWAHAIAPGANILVVEAAPAYSQSQELQNLLNAVNTARNTAGVVAISMSWGFNEMPNESSFDSYFTTPSGHQGITFIAASGDNAGVEYPSASPNVLSVGGTTLNLTSSGTSSSEAAWASGGGGYSSFEQEPSYQGSVQTSRTRSTPDVAFDADPNSGALVYSTAPGARTGSWQVVGGTSLGSPAWAAIIAIADQGRAVAGLGSLDGPTQTLPALYAAAASSAASSDFNTVAAAPSYGGFSFGGFNPFGGSTGSSSFWGGFAGGFGLFTSGTTTTGATANTASGLGTPKGAALIADLASSTLTRPLSSIVASTTTAGTTTTTTPEPVKPVKKHHVKKHHAATKHATHTGAKHKLVHQAHTSAKHVSGIRLIS